MIEWLLDFLDRALDLLHGLDPLLLALATAAFTALETTALIGMVVPGDAAVLLAASTADTPARFVMVLTAAALGTYTGELAGYGIGRAVGPRLRTSRFGRFLGEQRWARAEAYLSGRGAPVLVPIRFVSVLHAVAPVVAGTVKMPLRKFALWAGVGAVIWAVAYTSLGTAIGAAYREYRGLGLLISLAVISASAVAMYLRRWLHRRRDRAPVSLPDPRTDQRPDQDQDERLARRR
jgi:membrane-associated protein